MIMWWLFMLICQSSNDYLLIVLWSYDENLNRIRFIAYISNDHLMIILSLCNDHLMIICNNKTNQTLPKKVCLFVFLFVCLFVCLFVSLFVCFTIGDVASADPEARVPLSLMPSPYIAPLEVPSGVWLSTFPYPISLAHQGSLLFSGEHRINCISLLILSNPMKFGIP